MEACRLKMKGDYQKAAELFQNSLQIDNNSAISHFELGKILLMSGDDKNGLLLLQRAVSLNNDNDWYKIYLAGVYEHIKKNEKAISIYHQLSENNPEQLEYLYHLGDLYTQMQQYKEAVKIYNKIEEQEGINEPLVLEKQRLYLLSGDKKKAKEELEALLDKHPNEARYHIILGDYFLTINDHKKAIKSYKKAKSLEPNNGFLHLSLSNYYNQEKDSINSQQELLKAFRSKDIQYEPKLQMLLNYMVQYEKDSSLLNIIEDLTDALKTTYPEEANTYFFYANLWINDASKKEKVIDNLNTVLRLAPDNTDARMQLIQLAFQEEDFQQVLQYTQDALVAEVKTPQIYFYRGIAAQQEKLIETAKEAYEQGILITPDTEPLKSQMLGSLGDVHYEMKDAKQAFGYYEAALSLNEHNVLVLNNYAYYLSEEDTLLNKAENMSAKCIELEPGNPTYLDTYAWILYKRNNNILAKFYMEKAIHNSVIKSDVLLDHYADILYANDDKIKAEEYWKMAIEAGGDKEKIEKKLLNL